MVVPVEVLAAAVAEAVVAVVEVLALVSEVVPRSLLYVF